MVAVLFVYQIVKIGSTNFDHAVLCRLETADRKEAHTELQKLVFIHTLHHDLKGVGEVFEISVHAGEAFGKELCVNFAFKFCKLLHFVKGKLKVELSDLMVDDKN